MLTTLTEFLKFSDIIWLTFQDHLRLAGIDNAMDSSCPVTSKTHRVKSSAISPTQASTSYGKSRIFHLRAGIVLVCYTSGQISCFLFSEFTHKRLRQVRVFGLLFAPLHNSDLNFSQNFSNLKDKLQVRS